MGLGVLPQPCPLMWSGVAGGFQAQVANLNLWRVSPESVLG